MKHAEPKTECSHRYWCSRGVKMKAMTETRNLALSIVATVAETVAEPLLVLDSMMRVRTANKAFYRVFRTTPHDAEGQRLYSLSNARWDILALRDLLEHL